MKKINRLVTRWVKGTVQLSPYLQVSGYSRNLLNKYVKNGWLDSMGQGAFKLKGDSVGWEGALYALQVQKGMQIHAGGKTALQLKGYAHNVGASTQPVFLYGYISDRIPKWFMEQAWYNHISYTSTNLFNYSGLEAFSSYKPGSFEIKISSPELAIMELLYLVPVYQTFEEAMQIMEGLTTLRPALVQVLLEKCNSVKIKRLFLYMSEKNSHEWLKKLDLSKVSIGSGKRVIVKGGTLNKKYNITVPKEYE